MENNIQDKKDKIKKVENEVTKEIVNFSEKSKGYELLQDTLKVLEEAKAK